MRIAVLLATTLLVTTISITERETYAADEGKRKRLTLSPLADGDAIDQASCFFPSYDPYREPSKRPLLASSNLECEIWLNIDRKNIRVPSKNPADCGYWQLPQKRTRFVREYTDGTVNVRAEYLVNDVCWQAERCEHMNLEARFRVDVHGRKTQRFLHGVCGW
jgi:hypothetical protein